MDIVPHFTGNSDTRVASTDRDRAFENDVGRGKLMRQRPITLPIALIGKTAGTNWRAKWSKGRQSHSKRPASQSVRANFPSTICAYGTKPAFCKVFREAILAGLQRAAGIPPIS